MSNTLRFSRSFLRRGLLVAAPLAALTATQALAPGGLVAATANGDDGNKPAYAIDGNLSTRWSMDGKGAWLRGDMGAVKSLKAVDIAWYRGNERIFTFTLSTSTDGVTFNQVYSGQSSGKTAALERYTFAAANARYVKVTVNGSTMNTWASISELAVTADSTSTGGGDTGGGTGGDPGGGTTTPPPATGTDAFGVKMMYPSKAGGESWSLAADPTKDSRFDPQDTITKNSDGSWKIKSDQVRMSVFTSTGYSSSKIATYDPDVLASRGYMQAANDWKNIEMTGFVKLNGVSDTSDNFDWYARGGKHNDDLACEGTSYKAGLHYDGRARYQKESWHVSYEQADYKSVTKALKGRWVGFKAVMRNVPVNGKETVRLEMYLNDNADKVTWTKIYDMVDDGTWGGDTKKCGGSTGMPFTWGGPIATFRWDSATDVDFKWMSVREIQP